MTDKIDTGIFKVPTAYEVMEDGVFRRPATRITTRPLWISAIGRADDTVRAELAFRNITGETVKRWVPLDHISDRNKLIALSAYGVPVRTGNAAEVEAFLDEIIALNI